jgi:hypothetical protein
MLNFRKKPEITPTSADEILKNYMPDGSVND